MDTEEPSSSGSTSFGDSRIKDRGRLITFDISDEVTRFLRSADMSCSDLSFNVPGIVERYQPLNNDDGNIPTKDILDLARSFYDNRIVKDKDDAEILADYAWRELYTDIHHRLKHNRIDRAVMHRVKYRITQRGHNVSCVVLMRIT